MPSLEDVLIYGVMAAILIPWWAVVLSFGYAFYHDHSGWGERLFTLAWMTAITVVGASLYLPAFW